MGKKDIVGVEDTTCLEVESRVSVHAAGCPPLSIGRFSNKGCMAQTCLQQMLAAMNGENTMD